MNTAVFNSLGRRPGRRISFDTQKLLLASGLRGAIAFALALKARNQRDDR